MPLHLRGPWRSSARQWIGDTRLREDDTPLVGVPVDSVGMN